MKNVFTMIGFENRLTFDRGAKKYKQNGIERSHSTDSSVICEMGIVYTCISARTCRVYGVIRVA